MRHNRALTEAIRMERFEPLGVIIRNALNG